MLDYEQDSIELVTATAKLSELSLWVPSAPLGTAMPHTYGAFKAAEDAKAVQIDAGDPAKTMYIESSLDPK
jgi:hypothetical protein